MYLTINNYSSLGKIHLSKYVFSYIAMQSISHYKNIDVIHYKTKKIIKRILKTDLPLYITINKNNKVKLNINLSVHEESNVFELCKELQYEILENLTTFFDKAKYEVNLNILYIEGKR